MLPCVTSSASSLSLSLSLSQTYQPMSTLTHLFDLQEQICYVQCGFCTTILAVSVPCSSLSMVVTVRCGQCTSLLSVNMNKASFAPFRLLSSLNHLQPKEGGNPDEDAIKTCSDHEEDDGIPISYVINKQKKQRTPSAYNRFIKEEIRRLKAENPDMTHKEAFSTAAKNWAYFPQAYLKGDKENCSQTEQLVDMHSQVDPHDDAEVNEGGQGFRGGRSQEGNSKPFE